MGLRHGVWLPSDSSQGAWLRAALRGRVHGRGWRFAALKYVRKYCGSEELINGKDEWCLWLVDADSKDLRTSQFLRERVSKTREMRLASTKQATRDGAESTWLFQEIRQPEGSYLAIPSHFSSGRKYMTCAWCGSDIIASNAIFTCSDPDCFSFGIIESRTFIVWQSAVGGRLGNGYRFSDTMVWNNFAAAKNWRRSTL